MKKISALMTCHNRRETTLQCVERLYAQDFPSGVSFKVFLVDDGCTDGTEIAVKEAHPDVRVIKGSGDLFWCNGMRLAWEQAAKEDPDFYLWLNDDVQLHDNAVEKLLDCWLSVTEETSDDQSCSDASQFSDISPLTSNDLSKAVIVVGSTCDPETGEHTYGGQRRLGRHPGKVVRVPPSDVPQECDTLEGNIVLVPRTVYRQIGMLDRFSHAMGDTDYGYRAKKNGCRIWVAPGFLGKCRGNRIATTALSREKTLAERWRFRVSGKGLPPGDWFKFLIRHAGWRGIFYWGLSYLKVLLGR